MSLVWLASIWMTRRSQQQIDPQIPQTWCSYGSTVGYQGNHKWLVVEAVNHPILEAKTWTMMTAFMKITPTQLKSQIRAGHLLSSQIRLLLCAWEDLLIPSAKESARNIVISYHLYITLSQSNLRRGLSSVSAKWPSGFHVEISRLVVENGFFEDFR